MADEKMLVVFERDDRESVKTLLEGDQLQGWSDAMVIMERYGLSLTFDSERLLWTASDPNALYRIANNTPAGAIFLWDHKRQDASPRVVGGVRDGSSFLECSDCGEDVKEGEAHACKGVDQPCWLHGGAVAGAEKNCRQCALGNGNEVIE